MEALLSLDFEVIRWVYVPLRRLGTIQTMSLPYRRRTTFDAFCLPLLARFCGGLDRATADHWPPGLREV